MTEVTIILHDPNGNRFGRGRYAFGAYTVLGRLYYGFRTALPFFLISILLLFIPGESFFYGLFFFIFVPYQAFALMRLKRISFHIHAACPACGEFLHFPLDTGDQLPIWKYCPYCDSSFRMSETSSQAN